MEKLVVTRGGNFFSSTNCMLEDILEYFNKNKKLPETVDTSALWRPYKKSNDDDVANVFFAKSDKDITYESPVTFSSTDWEPQFSDYSKLNFKGLQPFIEKYCTLTGKFAEAEQDIMCKYKLDLNNTCGVFLRGNDKWKETNIPPYSEMIVKAYQIKKQNPTIQFLVQTDEKEFLEEFKSHFPEAIYVVEVPTRYRCRDNSHSCMAFVLPQDMLYATTYYFVAVLKLMAKMKFVIMTSGNGEMWVPLWRGHTQGVYQYLNPKQVMYGVQNKTYDQYKIDFWLEGSGPSSQPRFVCVNLECRPDRRAAMIAKADGLPLDIYKAVDGRKMELTDDIKEIFKNNQFHWRCGIMGCALSHINIWKELRDGTAPSYDYYVVLEDDTHLHPKFKQYFNQVYETMKSKSVNFLFLGHHKRDFSNYQFSDEGSVAVKMLNKQFYGGGTGGYVISKKCATIFLHAIEKFGCPIPVDDLLKAWNYPLFVCEPHIARNDIGVDSDIQVDFPRFNPDTREIMYHP